MVVMRYLIICFTNASL
jgi:ankyrin repeat protein